MKRILLVDDNEMNREMLSRRLSRRGFEVVTATNGQASIEIATSQQPDLILMDLGLPVVDGWEATRRLKANPATRQIPVLALTAHAMDGEREKSLANGCDEFDTKPINIDRLMLKIWSLLKKNEAL